MEATHHSPVAPAIGEKPARLPLVLSFLVPTLLVLLGYALAGIYPFGAKQTLTLDLQHQYYPFLVEFRRRLLSGGSLQWTWQVGLGSSFVPLYTYYLASPLNLLFLLVPEAFLREALLVLTAVRAGLAGLTCALCLRGLFGARDLSLAALSICYALCGFFLGYAIEILWMETFVLAPLCVLYTVRLLRAGRRAGYVLSLALAIWCNFYLGFMVCLFVLLTFVCVNVLDWPGLRAFFRRLLRIAACSAVAIGLCAVLLLPTMRALSYYGGAVDPMPALLGWHHSFVDVIGNLGLTAGPTTLRGLPNVYTGVLPLMMLGLLARTQDLRVRERALYLGMFALLLLSVNETFLDYLWHALHNPKSLPARYSFLLSLVMAGLSVRAFSVRARIGGWDFVWMAVPVAGVAVAALLGEQGLSVALWTLGAAAVYGLVMALWASGRVRKQTVAALLLCVVCLEAGVSVVHAMGVMYPEDTSKRAEYPYFGKETAAMLAEAEADTDDLFYRVETTRSPHTTNAPALLGYTGVTSFSSTINTHVASFSQKLGLSARADHLRQVYDETSPLTNAFLDVDYYVASNGFIRDPSQYWQAVARDGITSLYKNRYPLSLGFMVNPTLLAFEGDADNPFLSQNELLTLSTGLEADLFTPSGTAETSAQGYAVTETAPGTYMFVPDGNEAGGNIRFDITFEEDALYYGYLYVEHFEFGYVYEGRSKREWQVMRPFIQCLGHRTAGETMALEAFTGEAVPGGAARLYLYKIDPELFAKGYGRLSASQMTVTHRTDTALEGTVDATVDGLLYTSIPYEPGWSLRVDGTPAEIALVGDAMLCVPLKAGAHTLHFSYRTPGLLAGAAVSAACLLLLLGIVWLDLRANRHKDGEQSALRTEGREKIV